MEPLAALATFENGKCDIWAPTQHPQAARDTVAGALKIPVEDVRVSVTLLGGGFGRKSKPDFIVEAALLARETGKPVKVVWTREDDIQHDYFHTVGWTRMGR
jgi:isoquinoline 1-oxidoreductase beta subunit